MKAFKYEIYPQTWPFLDNKSFKKETKYVRQIVLLPPYFKTIYYIIFANLIFFYLLYILFGKAVKMGGKRHI